MIRELIFTCALAFAGIAAAAPPVEIVGAEFGIFEEVAPRELAFEPTRVVPHKEGQRYGWVIEVRTTKRHLSVREEYLLPSRTLEASKDGTVVIPLDRRAQVSERQLAPVDGRIYGEWAVGPGEPAGQRRLEVIVEGQAVSFEYELR